MYYERDDRGVPKGWVARMKNAPQTLAWRFNADRMVLDYIRYFYLPAVGWSDSSTPGNAVDLIR